VTGLYYARARYYDPDLRRFVSEDPAGLSRGVNPYVFAGNDPVNGTDPSGLSECLEWEVVTIQVSQDVAQLKPICLEVRLDPEIITAKGSSYFDALWARLTHSEI